MFKYTRQTQLDVNSLMRVLVVLESLRGMKDVAQGTDAVSPTRREWDSGRGPSTLRSSCACHPVLAGGDAHGSEGDDPCWLAFWRECRGGR